MYFSVSDVVVRVSDAGYGGLQCKAGELTILPPAVWIDRVPSDVIPTDVWVFEAGCISIFSNDSVFVVDISLHFINVQMVDTYNYISVSIYGFSLNCDEPSMLVVTDSVLASCQQCHHLMECSPSGGSMTNEGHMMCMFHCHINPQEGTIIVRLQRMKDDNFSYHEWQLCGINATLLN